MRRPVRCHYEGHNCKLEPNCPLVRSDTCDNLKLRENRKRISRGHVDAWLRALVKHHQQTSRSCMQSPRSKCKCSSNHCGCCALVDVEQGGSAKPKEGESGTPGTLAWTQPSPGRGHGAFFAPPSYRWDSRRGRSGMHMWKASHGRHRVHVGHGVHWSLQQLRRITTLRSGNPAR